MTNDYIISILQFLHVQNVDENFRRILYYCTRYKNNPPDKESVYALRVFCTK